MVECKPCAQCGCDFEPGDKGQKKSWCLDCRRRYMRDYMRARYRPILGPPKPKPPPKEPRGSCEFCGRAGIRRGAMTCGRPECIRQRKLRRHYEYQREHPRRKKSWSERKRNQLVRRDGWCCGICGGLIDPALKWPNPRSFSVDHVLPIARGGTDELSNLQPAHLGCNWSKGDDPSFSLAANDGHPGVSGSL